VKNEELFDPSRLNTYFIQRVFIPVHAEKNKDDLEEDKKKLKYLNIPFYLVMFKDKVYIFERKGDKNNYVVELFTSLNVSEIINITMIPEDKLETKHTHDDFKDKIALGEVVVFYY
jgi:predicted NUDIX family phosphoesterase